MDWAQRIYDLVTDPHKPLYSLPVDKLNREIVTTLSTIISNGSIKFKKDPDSMMRIDEVDLLHRLKESGNDTSIELRINNRSVKIEQCNGGIIISAGEERCELYRLSLKGIYQTLLNDIIDHPDNYTEQQLDYPLNHILLDTENEFADVNQKVAIYILCSATNTINQLQRWTAINHVLNHCEEYLDDGFYQAVLLHIIDNPDNHTEWQLERTLNHILLDTENEFPDINQKIASYIIQNQGNATTNLQRSAALNHIFKYGKDYHQNTWIEIIESAEHILNNQGYQSAETIKCAEMLYFFCKAEWDCSMSKAIGEKIVNNSDHYPPEFITYLANQHMERNANFFTLPFTAQHKFMTFFRGLGKIHLVKEYDQKLRKAMASNNISTEPESVEQFNEMVERNQSMALFLIKNRFDPAIIYFRFYVDLSKSTTINTSSS